jgi:hypothetical protein
MKVCVKTEQISSGRADYFFFSVSFFSHLTSFCVLFEKSFTVINIYNQSGKGNKKLVSFFQFQEKASFSSLRLSSQVGEDEAL